MTEERFPILGKGEVLTELIPTPKQPNTKKPLRTFDAARERLLPQLEILLKQINSSDASMRLQRVFFQVSLDYKYLAKSYYPASLVKASCWDLVGSRPWRQKARDGELLTAPELARTLFLCADPIRIEDTFSRLERSNLHDKEKEDLIKIDNLGLQLAAEKFIGSESDFEKGVLELVFHPMPEREWKECRRKLDSLFPDETTPSFLWNWERGNETQPIFVPALLTMKDVSRIVNFNPLRAARPMPSISFPRMNKEKILRIKTPPFNPLFRATYPEIAVIDGGADVQIPHLRGWVSNSDITPEPAHPGYLEHGTAVCGAVLYGPNDFKNKLDEPRLRVKSFRVFPVPREFGLDLDLYRILDWLENIVNDPDNRNLHVYVLSFGPDMPIEDYEVNRYTAVLDKLAYQHDVLFIVAAGNTGHCHDPLNRIQPPADIVNGIGVGAYTFVGNDNGKIRPTSYCCVGPGRSGSMVKPDICAFGGSEDHPFHVLLAGTDGGIAEEQGTSFAAQVVASVAGNLLYRASEPGIVTPQVTKAIIVHHARPFKKIALLKYGWGALCAGPESLMRCSANEVKVLYNGVVELKSWVRLHLPFPEKLEYDGMVHFEWTLVYACDVCPAMPDDYTLAGTEIIFRPNLFRFRYSQNDNFEFIDELTDPDLAEEFLTDGWKKSLHPASSNYKREQQLREQGKWDTVVRGRRRVSRDKVKQPALDLHAIGRGDWNNKSGGPGKINYAAVVSVRVSDRKVRIYDLVKTQIPELVPVRLRTRARHRINANSA